MSSAIASSILRMFSACCSWCAAAAERRKLGDAVDERSNTRAEALLDVAQLVLGVLGNVVQQRGLDRLGVQPEVLDRAAAQRPVDG